MVKGTLLRAAVIAAAVLLAPASPARAADPAYDLLIRHGRILDGSGNPWFYADLAIKNGRIAALGDLPPSASAAQTLDATGLVVAPGFIDVHTHADTDLYSQPSADNFIRDGVTTIVTGNCGYGVRDVAGYFAHLRAHGTAVNVATLIGHNTVLREVKGDKAGDLTPDQLARARSLVAQAMRDGAVGLSTGLIYRPGTYSKIDEIIDLQKVAAGFGGIYATHMRSEGMGVLDAIDEALTVGRQAHCRVEISHFKLSADAARKFGGSDATLAKVLAARAAGQEVWLDQYPYTASSTSISTLLPDDFLAAGEDPAKQKLKDPRIEDQVVEEMRHTYEDERGRKHLGYVVIASSAAHPQYNGYNLMQVAQLMKLKAAGNSAELLGSGDSEPQLPPVSMADQCRAALDLWKDGGASCVFHSMREPDVENIMKCPLVSIASDSGVRQFGAGMPHPRGYGTNARVLGHFVREQHLLPLEDAVRKMTSQPATAFRLADRGLLRPGFFADITIFDPATILDKATFENPHQYPVGIEYVLVNGQLVLSHGQLTGRLPGLPLPGPGYHPSSTTSPSPSNRQPNDPRRPEQP